MAKKTSKKSVKHKKFTKGAKSSKKKPNPLSGMKIVPISKSAALKAIADAKAAAPDVMQGASLEAILRDQGETVAADTLTAKVDTAANDKDITFRIGKPTKTKSGFQDPSEGHIGFEKEVAKVIEG